ncbi:MAG TPA: aspartate carbamoyltransferase, partial [Chromatiaceae bacterium]|nr:aspartate carbamoyltransferase [Chromatiaceae bacterium]
AEWMAFYGGHPWLFGLLAVMALISALLGRALFYAVVIPTTMPGAFFWRNPGFVEHAREAGLAEMPQLGVAYERHHPFRLDELIETIRTTSFSEKLDQFKRIFTG